jgi:hypothetical protein
MDEDADTGDPGSDREVWAVGLSAHHGAVEERGWQGGKDRVQRIRGRSGIDLLIVPAGTNAL